MAGATATVAPTQAPRATLAGAATRGGAVVLVTTGKCGATGHMKNGFIFPVLSLLAALGGLDGLVFTVGVGENAASIRAEICRACAWLGLDDEANARHGPCISGPESQIRAYVIPTDENLMISRHARALARAGN